MNTPLADISRRTLRMKVQSSLKKRKYTNFNINEPYKKADVRKILNDISNITKTKHHTIKFNKTTLSSELNPHMNNQSTPLGERSKEIQNISCSPLFVGNNSYTVSKGVNQPDKTSDKSLLKSDLITPTISPVISKDYSNRSRRSLNDNKIKSVSLVAPKTNIIRPNKKKQHQPTPQQIEEWCLVKNQELDNIENTELIVE